MTMQQNSCIQVTVGFGRKPLAFTSTGTAILATDNVEDPAGALLELEAVSSVAVDGTELIVSSNRARDVAVALPRLPRSLGARLDEVRPLDDSLESMFRELVR